MAKSCSYHAIVQFLSVLISLVKYILTFVLLSCIIEFNKLVVKKTINARQAWHFISLTGLIISIKHENS